MIDRPLPPLQSLVYDEEGYPMRVVGVRDDIATLAYEGGEDRGFLRLMGTDELYQAMCKPYPDGTYDVTIEVRATRTIRVPGDRVPELSQDMLPGTDNPPIPLGQFMVYSIRPVRVLGVDNL